MTALAGRIAVVTGAGSGIGRAIALALGTKGETLAVVGRRLAPLEDLISEIREVGAATRAFLPTWLVTTRSIALARR